MDYTLHFGVIWSNADRLLSGLLLGLALACGSILAGSTIGLACAFAAGARWPPLRTAVAAYVTAVRNTPLLLIVLAAFFALPELGIRLGKVQSFVISLTLYAGAYLTEVFRSGLTGVPRGAIDAGLAVGLSPLQVGLLIRMPIMLRNVLPALGSTFISLFKDTSIAAAIAVPELTFQARRSNVESFRVVEAWLAASALYVATCFLLAAGLRRLERRFPRF